MTRAVSADTLQRIRIRDEARRWGRDPYAQALVAGLRRWTIRLALAWVALLLLVVESSALMQWSSYRQARARTWEGIHHSLDQADFQFDVMGLVSIFVVPTVLALAGHLRRQIADWTGGLLPRYRAAQLTVFGTSIVLVTLLVALAVWMMTPLSLAALISMSLAVAALTAWLACVSQRTAAILVFAVIAGLSPTAVRRAGGLVLLGETPLGTLAVLVAAASALVALGWRLATLPVESWADTNADQLRLGRWRPAARAAGGLAPMHAWSRVRLWRVPSSSGYFPAACALALLALMVAVTRESGGAPLLAILSALLPLAAVVSQWDRRMPRFGAELLRPITRKQFVGDMLAALAADFLAWWLPLTAAAAIGLTWSLHSLRAPQLDDPGHWASMLAAVILISAALQLFFYATVAWVLTLQNRWVLYTTMVALLLLAIPAALLLQVTTIPLALTLAAVLSTLAWRRWLRTDFA